MSAGRRFRPRVASAACAVVGAAPVAVACAVACAVAVLASPVRAQPEPLPEVLRRARVNPALGVDFAAAVVPETVVVGQQALFQVAVLVSDEVRNRLRRNPEFLPPELRSVLAYDPPGSYRRFERVVLGGRVWEAHVFQRAVFPLAPGRVQIPAARLTYAVPQSSSFFAREETFTLRTDPVTLDVRDPPSAGRPDDWDGAVGRFALSARVDPRQARVGDPVTVTLRVQGTGHVPLLPRPRLRVPWGDAVPAGERVTLDSVALTVAGAKEFDWIVTPLTGGTHVVPATRFPSWDPAGGRWTIAISAPESLEVAAGSAVTRGTVPAATAAASGEAPLAIRRTWHGARAPRPWRTWPFWLLAGLAPAALVRRRPRRSATPKAGVRNRAPDADPYAAFHARLRAAAELPVGADAGAVVRALRRAGVTVATASRAAAHDAALAAAAYGPRASPARLARLADESDAIARSVASELARRRPHRPAARGITGRRVVAWLGGAVLAAGTLWATGDLDPARRAFEDGVARYDAGDMRSARVAFDVATRHAPEAADAWANAGTASWAVADSGAAAHAWQRALRLEPSATDVRSRLAALPGSALPWASPLAIWPVAASWLAWGGLALLWAGLLLARRRLAVAPGALACAGLVGMAAAVAARREAGTGLAVVTAGGPLRALPALGAEPAGTVLTGEPAERLEGRDGWWRIRAPGGREGWLDERQVRALDGTPATGTAAAGGSR